MNALKHIIALRKTHFATLFVVLQMVTLNAADALSRPIKIPPPPPPPPLILLDGILSALHTLASVVLP